MAAYNKHTTSALTLIFCLGMLPHALAATCNPSSLDLELVSATGTGATSHPIAKCFSSMTVSVLSDCTLTVNANGQNNFVQALWSADTTYAQVTECPNGASMESASDPAASATALATLMSTSIYAEGMTASVAAAPGFITITSTYLSNPAVLKFRASGVSGTPLPAMFSTVGAAACTTGPECASTAIGCGAGSYPVQIGATGTYICALCSSGTYSAAGSTACTKCIAGKALAAVGTTSDICSSCLAGTFATSGSSDCRPCAPGMYQDGGAQSSCKPCPSTWSSHIYGATQCVKCLNGRPAVCASSCSTTAGTGNTYSFTATMDSAALLTASGWDPAYSYPALLNPCSPATTTVSFTVDETCAMEIRTLGVTAKTAGLMCSDPSNVDSGVFAYYTSTTTIMSLLADAVPKGNILKVVPNGVAKVTMSVTASTSYPIAPTGTISGDLTVTGGSLVGVAVSTCPTSTVTLGSGATLSCDPCDAGMACSTGSAVSCNAGTYSTMGQALCTSCPVNTYAPETGSTECTACSGTVGSSDTTCEGATVDCPDGQQLNPATNLCECSAGYAGVSCTICGANKYSSGGTDICHNCATNTFSAAGSESCGVCPAGQAKNGSGVCAPCTAGQEPNSDSTACVACSSGFYNPDSGGIAQFDKCQRCDSGKYTDAGKTSCTNCLAGTYATWTSASVRAPSDPTTCAACPDGGYSAAGAKRCTPCPGGSEKTSAGTACQKCLAGTFRTPFSAGPCTACPAGTFAKAGADTCLSCSPGQYSAASASSCSTCPADTYASDSGSTTCDACQAGSTTSGETGATGCGPCGVGTAYDSVTKTCVDCNPGFYQDRAGQSSCKRCPIGTFSDESASETCTACPAGKYQSVAGSQTCRTCPGGTFSAAGKGSCAICDKGKYSAPGATACIRCSAGYYANKLGSRTCTACPSGSKCAGVGSTGPILCPAGSYQAKPAQTTCTPCPKKTNAAKSGAIKCSSCPNATTVGTATCPARRRMLLTRLGADIFSQ